jgi:hypothetical protein
MVLLAGIRSKKIEADTSFQMFPPVITQPPVQKQVSIEEIQEQKIDTLKSLLTKSISSLKRELPTLSPSQLSKLLTLETQGKKRKSVLSLLTSLLEKYKQDVSAKVGTEDIVPGMDNAELFKGMKSLDLDNISDVIESNIETVTIPVDKE